MHVFIRSTARRTPIARCLRRYAACAVLLTASLPAYTAPLPVTVAIPPQAWVVERLAGDAATVAVLLPPSAGHVSFNPGPVEMIALSQAAIIVRSGLPFENQLWDRIRSANTSASIVAAPAGADHDGHGHDTDHHNPHFWVDPALMAEQSAELAAALKARLPEHAQTIDSNLAELRDDLDALDRSLVELFAGLANNEMWSFHSSWGPFADHYGLEHHAIESEGKSPGLQTMIRIAQAMQASNADIVFAEPGLNPRQILALQNATGLRVVVLDPMRRDYPENLLSCARDIAESLR